MKMRRYQSIRYSLVCIWILTLIVLWFSSIRIEELDTLERIQYKSIWLIRSIGNSLPPRHVTRQSIINLEFILRHETTDDPILHKHWFLNRISDKEFESKVVDLLQHYGHSYTIVPFELHEYAKLRYNIVDNQKNALDYSLRGKSEWEQTLIEGAIRDDKIKYAIHVNGVRNQMIEYGRKQGARWILPWDQSCFLTTTAWNQIRDRLDASTPFERYYVTWMYRITDENSKLLFPAFEPPDDIGGEPQIILRSDSDARFDETLRYGRRDKAALLVRLNVPGPWDGWTWDTYEQSRLSRLPTSPAVGSVGWVARLNSGNQQLERKEAAHTREVTRGRAITLYLTQLDARVASEIYRFDPKNMMFFNPKVLDHLFQTYFKHIRRKLNLALEQHVEFTPIELLETFSHKVVMGYITEDTELVQSAMSYLVALMQLDDEWDLVAVISSSKEETGCLAWVSLCDSLRIVPKVDERIRNWIRSILEKLRRMENKTGNTKIGVALSTAIVATAGYLNESSTVLYYLETVRRRLTSSYIQIDLFEKWAILFIIAKSVGFELDERGLLCEAVRNVVPCCYTSSTHCPQSSTAAFIARFSITYCHESKQVMIPAECTALARSLSEKVWESHSKAVFLQILGTEGYF